MKPLTLDHAIENGFTPSDCIKYFLPDLTDEEIGFYLWEETPFPLINGKELIDYLNSKFIYEHRI